MASAAAKRPRQISHHARRWPTCGPTIKTYGYRPTSVLRACMHVLRAGINFYSTCPTSLRPRNNRPRCQITRSLPACMHACGHIALCEHNRTAAGLASGKIHPVPRLVCHMGCLQSHKADSWASFPTPFRLCEMLSDLIKNGMFLHQLSPQSVYLNISILKISYLFFNYLANSPFLF
jgi:hypothetical protein